MPLVDVKDARTTRFELRRVAGHRRFRVPRGAVLGNQFGLQNPKSRRFLLALDGNLKRSIL